MIAWTGIYTPQEAAALLHEQPSTVRRWAFGYRRNRASGVSQHPPLILTELPEMEGQRALTFVELIELLYIRAFQRAGVSWAVIRQAAAVAARLYRSDHPFALRHVYADPNGLYAAVDEDDGTQSLVQLIGHGQHAMEMLVKPYLDQIEFDVNDVAVRWWPMGRAGGVVVDPRHSFGAPTVQGIGIRTSVLADAHAAERAVHGEQALDRVAWAYEISPREVQTAVDFERWLLQAA
ncbi:MAG TPA: hypothetical protein VFH27_09295 [Longimicrobiaceae bacterium]|nr:hypothetical protein [Longimicrobiaceae bacterium]